MRRVHIRRGANVHEESDIGPAARSANIAAEIITKQKLGVSGYECMKSRTATRLNRCQRASLNDPQQCLKSSCSVRGFSRSDSTRKLAQCQTSARHSRSHSLRCRRGTIELATRRTRVHHHSNLFSAFVSTGTS